MVKSRSGPTFRVVADLSQNCLQRSSADDKSRHQQGKSYGSILKDFAFYSCYDDMHCHVC